MNRYKVTRQNYGGKLPGPPTRVVEADSWEAEVVGPVRFYRGEGEEKKCILWMERPESIELMEDENQAKVTVGDRPSWEDETLYPWGKSLFRELNEQLNSRAAERIIGNDMQALESAKAKFLEARLLEEILVSPSGRVLANLAKRLVHGEEKAEGPQPMADDKYILDEVLEQGYDSSKRRPAGDWVQRGHYALKPLEIPLKQVETNIGLQWIGVGVTESGTLHIIHAWDGPVEVHKLKAHVGPNFVIQEVIKEPPSSP